MVNSTGCKQHVNWRGKGHLAFPISISSSERCDSSKKNTFRLWGEKKSDEEYFQNGQVRISKNLFLSKSSKNINIF